MRASREFEHEQNDSLLGDVPIIGTSAETLTFIEITTASYLFLKNLSTICFHAAREATGAPVSVLVNAAFMALFSGPREL